MECNYRISRDGGAINGASDDTILRNNERDSNKPVKRQRDRENRL